MTTKQRRLVRFTAGMVAAWIVASFIGGAMIRNRTQEFEVLGPANIGPPETIEALIIRSILAGIVAGVLAAFLELKVFPRFARTVSAGTMLTLRTFGYAAAATVVVLAALFVISTWEMGVPLWELLTSPGFAAFLQSGVALQLILTFVVSSFVINGALQVWRLLGPGAASQILLGRYLRPIHEERSFLFIDLADSTGIAERLGPLQFADFKNDFFHDLAEPVLDCKGQIVQYVGDEVMITWPRTRRAQSTASDAVRCFFDVRRRVHANAKRYQSRYGEVPRFRAGLHSGAVVVSQLGDLKREIVFSGDAVNAAARIQGLCKQLDRDFLASDDVMGDAPLPDDVAREDLGSHTLRGRTAPITLIALSARTPQPQET